MSTLKRCAKCGAEFQPWVERCIDCGGALEADDGSAPPPKRVVVEADDDHDEPHDDELADEEEGVLLRIVPLNWARGLSAALAARGIAHRIEEAPATAANPRDRSGSGMVAVYVHPEDRADAIAVDIEHQRGEIPDLPDEAGSAEHCPACGEPCEPEAVECASCGLEFPSNE